MSEQHKNKTTFNVPSPPPEALRPGAIPTNPLTHRKCFICGNIYELGAQNFRLSQGGPTSLNPSGLAYTCIPCAEQKERRATGRKTHKPAPASRNISMG